MAKAKPVVENRGLAPNDPKRPLMVRRLKTARARIELLLSRPPAIQDPEFDEWEDGVRATLTELFGASQYLLSFRRIQIRPINYRIDSEPAWYSDPQVAWESGLKRAANLLDEAIEEAEIEIPIPTPNVESQPSKGSPIVVTVNNNNVFSPSIHVTISQTLAQLERMELSAAEKALASQHLKEIESETKGAGRWPIIAQSIESLKSIGKSIYKDLAVPLLVEYLKKESGLT